MEEPEPEGTVSFHLSAEQIHKKKTFAYLISVNVAPSSWSVLRNEEELRHLHNTLSSKFPDVHLPEPPPKLLASNNADYIHQRREHWRAYLKRLSCIPQVVTSGHLDTFLELCRVWTRVHCEAAEVEGDSVVSPVEDETTSEIDHILLLQTQARLPVKGKQNFMSEEQVAGLMREHSWMLRKVNDLQNQLIAKQNIVDDTEMQKEIDKGVKDFLLDRTKELEERCSALEREHEQEVSKLRKELAEAESRLTKETAHKKVLLKKIEQLSGDISPL